MVVGLVFGSSWLVRCLKGDEKVILVRAEFLAPHQEVSKIPASLSKEEKKELKRKYKAERKNHRPSSGRR